MFILIALLLVSTFQVLVFCISEPDPFIIGGEDAFNKEHAFMVSIFLCSGNNCKGDIMCEAFVCGGTLIHPQWVLTAAHCFTPGVPVSFYQAVVGDYKITSESETTEYRAEIEEFIVHENFTITDYVLQNDIALIKLKTEVPDDKLQCLTMNIRNTEIERTKCLIYGWGWYEQHPNHIKCKLTETLKYLEVGLLYTNVCQTDYNDKNWTIYDSNICSGVLDNGNAVEGKGACYGDSGGGLLCENTETQGWELVGVTSYGDEVCAQNHRPTVYTRITHFRSWIFEICPECQDSVRCFLPIETPTDCHGGDYFCTMENICDVGEGNCISNNECQNDLVCNDCRGSSHADECCQYQNMQGCLRPRNKSGVWECPGDMDSDNIEESHICVLKCDDGNFGGFLVCLGHGIWEDKDFSGCQYY